ncbi:MAG: STM4014 family protein [Alphaproteobacteria bacterium]|nr:STM4014 family protein [Alphaproteobacteria bacterium]
MKLLVLGNPENRRVALFVDAARGLGLPEPDVVPWAALARDPSVLLGFPDEPRVVRLDSTGENAEVEALLLARGHRAALGYGCEVIEPGTQRGFGQVLGPRQAHLGFLDLLDVLQGVLAERPSWRVPQPFDTIRACFDKDATANALAAAGVPVARAVPCRTAREVLDAHLAEGRALWVKVTCASSASCLAVVRGGAQPHAMTTLRETDAGRFNSLRVVRVQGDRLEPMLDWLLCEGSRVEVDEPKARLDGAFFDLRVLVIRGEPRFVVVRQSRHGITNLHLGGWRGDTEALWAALGSAGRAALLDLCRAVGEALPCWYLGIDVLVAPGFDRFCVLEVNAFGDLLPRLENAGLDTYGAEIAALLPSGTGPVLQSP